jgi:hypothetical protein
MVVLELPTAGKLKSSYRRGGSGPWSGVQPDMSRRKTSLMSHLSAESTVL